MRCHQSLAGPDGANLFADSGDEYGLSDLAKSFIAGQLAHARGMLVIVNNNGALEMRDGLNEAARRAETNDALIPVWREGNFLRRQTLGEIRDRVRAG